MVVFMSDHGRFLGDHWMDNMPPAHFEEVLRVPNLWRFPQRFRSGLASDSLVSHLDFAPTILHLTQFEPSDKDGAKGTLVFSLPAGLVAGPMAATVLGPPRGSSAVLPHLERFEVAENGETLRFDTYSASPMEGVLRDISVLGDGGTTTRVAARIIVFCKETGWSREEGMSDLVHHGATSLVRSCTHRRVRSSSCRCAVSNVMGRPYPMISSGVKTRSLPPTAGRALARHGRLDHS